MDHVDWLDTEHALELAANLAKQVAPGGIVIWRSASLKPPYSDLIAKAGFDVKRLDSADKGYMDKVRRGVMHVGACMHAWGEGEHYMGPLAYRPGPLLGNRITDARGTALAFCVFFALLISANLAQAVLPQPLLTQLKGHVLTWTLHASACMRAGQHVLLLLHGSPPRRQEDQLSLRCGSAPRAAPHMWTERGRGGVAPAALLGSAQLLRALSCGGSCASRPVPPFPVLSCKGHRPAAGQVAGSRALASCAAQPCAC